MCLGVGELVNVGRTELAGGSNSGTSPHSLHSLEPNKLSTKRIY